LNNPSSNKGGIEEFGDKRKALKEMEKNPDDAHRVLYVGVTRTKKNLVLKMPEDSQRGWAV